MLNQAMTLDTLVLVIIVALICYSVVDALVNHDGPKGVLASIRHRVGVNVPVMESVSLDSHTDIQADTGEFTSNGTWLAGVFDCSYCMTPYVAALVTAVMFVFTPLDSLFETAVVYVSSWGLVWFMLDLS